MRIVLFVWLLLVAPLASSDSYTFYGFEYPPFSTKGEGSQNNGPFADLIREFCRQQQYECDVLLVPWRRASKAAKEGNSLHGLFPMSKNADREQWLYYSDPFIVTGRGFYTLDSSHTINRLNDFEGYTISTFGPSNTARIMSKHLEVVEDISIILETKMDIAVNKFIHGRYGEKSALYGNIDVIRHILSSNNFAAAHLAYITKRYVLYLTFPKHTVSPELVEEFNRFINQQSQSGALGQGLGQYGLQLDPELIKAFR